MEGLEITGCAAVSVTPSLAIESWNAHFAEKGLVGIEAASFADSRYRRNREAYGWNFLANNLYEKGRVELIIDDC